MKTIYEANDAILEFDEEKTTLYITWKGEVSETSVIKVLSLAAKASYLTDTIHWLIDRRQLESYEAEARIWVKNDFIDKVGKELIQKTDKIAAVMSDSAMAQVSSNVLIDLIVEQNPNIAFKEFDMVLPASNWLIGSVEETKEEPKKKKGFFSRK
ncbi:hypothetical protein SAMN04488028_1045 [Reichenbachiella agariperforans]|uniref:SpoIIAA-like n=1 Tax=Reichenbachiella agariperforans TaxID=156994 RepID=A0A1M6R1A9_REIAG|nr:hypothetical protein [Reichenbachiella agariperforans]SHK26242.1 hypothetical protein SAMN04488028_1045 [Reichenbachiella agariperforans]